MSEASSSHSVKSINRRPSSYTYHVTLRHCYEQIPVIITINHIVKDGSLKIEVIPKDEVYENNLYVAKLNEGMIGLAGLTQSEMGYAFCRELCIRFQKSITLHCKLKLTDRPHIWLAVKMQIREMIRDQPHMFVR